MKVVFKGGFKTDTQVKLQLRTSVEVVSNGSFKTDTQKHCQHLYKQHTGHETAICSVRLLLCNRKKCEFSLYTSMKDTYSNGRALMYI